MSADAGFSMGRRNQLARDRGFRTYAQQRRFDRSIDNRTKLAALPERASETRQASLDALATARREGIDLASAAEREGITVEALSWWVGDALHRQGGALVPRKGDRLFRPMYAYSGGRVVDLDLRGSDAASTIGAYHSAVQHYLHHSDPSRLARFAGKRVGGVELETDLDVIDELARRGEFDFESIYRMVGS
jgi:hypothetical protein